MEQALAICTPRDATDRKRCLFNLAKAARYNLSLGQENGLRLAHRWHELVRGNALPEEEWQDTATDFMRAWHRARSPLRDMLAEAVSVATHSRHPLPPLIEEGSSVALIWRTAYCLAAAVAPDDVIYLPCPRLEELIGFDRRKVHRCLWTLEHMGWLTCMARGKPGIGGVATRYRWNSAKQREEECDAYEVDRDL